MNVTPEMWSTLWFARVRAQVECMQAERAGMKTASAVAARESAEHAIAELRATAVVPATWLRTRLGLSETEEQVIWLLVAVELSAPIRALVQAVAGTTQPTIAFVQHVIYGSTPSLQAWRELGPSGLLRRLELVVAAGRRDELTPDFLQPVRVHPRICALALGDETLDDEISKIGRIVDDAMPLADVVVPDEVPQRVTQQIASTTSILLATGPRGCGRATLVRAASADARLRLLDIDAHRLASDGDAVERQLRRIAREAQLLACAVLLRNVDALGDRAGRVDELVGNTRQPVSMTAQKRPDGLAVSRPVIQIELGAITTAQRLQLWKRAIPAASESEQLRVATTYALAPALIHHAGRAIAARTSGVPSPEDVLAGIDAVLDDQLGRLATRIRTTQTWEDIVLPADQLDVIIEMIARIRDRHRVYEEWGFGGKLQKGLGVTTLMSGPPGTGKTMVAGLIARELGLPLYQVDLARMVSKWIGETEKNLAAVFDAAEAGHAILLFDEADSLFAKRTEVNTSNDRHANLEVNYLLQRLESFTGVCILTTNHERAIDDAFRRRLAFHLRFEVPDDRQRALLWRSVFPRSAPLDPGVDFELLARKLDLSGGHIRNAALRAAFLASDAGTPIQVEHVWRAALAEYEAIGKIAPLSMT